VTRLALLLLCVAVAACSSAPPVAETKTAAVAPVVQEEPDEPCEVLVKPSPMAEMARAAAQSWCQGGMFTKVVVNTDASNFVFLMQMSKKTQRTWEANRFQVLNPLRRITDDMVQTSDMNVAFSVHDTNGDLAGGCYRKRSETESTCK
jgi:hypothetical protein